MCAATVLQWDSASPEMRKQLLKQAAKRKAAAAAQDQLQAIKAHSSKRVCSGDKYGEVVLPPGVLQQVMACLAAIEPDGVRGPAMAAADLANAALVSSSGAHCLGRRPCRIQWSSASSTCGCLDTMHMQHDEA
jgi:hypothetical protein